MDSWGSDNDRTGLIRKACGEGSFLFNRVGGLKIVGYPGKNPKL